MSEFQYFMKPRPVLAIQWTGENILELRNFLQTTFGGDAGNRIEFRGKCLSVNLRTSNLVFEKGEWMVYYGDSDWNIVPDKIFQEEYQKDVHP